ALPGLYPLSTAHSSTPPLPFANNPAVTDLAIFPNYGTTPPTVINTLTGVGTNPSAIDIDPTLGVVVVVETGSNQVQFFRIASQANPANGAVYDNLIPIDYVSGQDCIPS